MNYEKIPAENTKEEKLELIREKDILDLYPKPGEEKPSLPVLVAPGWADTAKAMKKPLEALVEKGRRALTLDYPRKSLINESIEGQSIEAAQRAFTLLETIDKKDLKEVDAIGYSEGGLDLAIAASLRPEKFRNLVFVAPAGMIGKDSFYKLAKRFAAEIATSNLGATHKPETIKPVYIMTQEFFKYVAENPKLATREVKAMVNADIYQMVKDLKAKGIRISFVCGADDKVFLMNKIQKKLSEEFPSKKDENGNVISKGFNLDGFCSVKGGHQEILLHPKKYMSAIEELLTSLKKKSKLH